MRPPPRSDVLWKEAWRGSWPRLGGGTEHGAFDSNIKCGGRGFPMAEPWPSTLVASVEKLSTLSLVVAECAAMDAGGKPASSVEQTRSAWYP